MFAKICVFSSGSKIASHVPNNDTDMKKTKGLATIKQDRQRKTSQFYIRNTGLIHILKVAKGIVIF